MNKIINLTELIDSQSGPLQSTRILGHDHNPEFSGQKISHCKISATAVADLLFREKVRFKI